MSKYITEINYSGKEDWNSIVRSFPNYEAFYLNEYVSAFVEENSANGIPVLLLYKRGEERAINVVFKRDVAKDSKFEGRIVEGKYFDLITNYGYGGFMGRIEDYEKLNHEYNLYCVEKNYICEFVRFSLFSDYYRYYDGDVYSLSHNVVRNLEPPIDEMWMNFKQKVRKNVKCAKKNGLEIIIENASSHLGAFLEIYYSTMERCNAENRYYFSEQFYNKLGIMKENIMYFHVTLEGEIISTELVIYGKDNVYSYLGGTKKECFNLRPNDFLKFEIIKWAKKKGLKNFVLGGGYGTDDSIFQYKLCFAPQGVHDFHIGKKIWDREKYVELCSLRGIELTEEGYYEGFFPRYRMEKRKL